MIASLFGIGAIIGLFAFWWYRRYGRDGKERFRRAALKRLPIHSALIRRKSVEDILATIERDGLIARAGKKGFLTQEIDKDGQNTENTIYLKDFDGRTVMDLCLKDSDSLAPEEVVLAVLLKSLPVRIETNQVVAVPPEKHVRIHRMKLQVLF